MPRRGNVFCKYWYIAEKCYPKGSSISSRTHFKGWKRDFLFLTLQKQAKKQHFLPFSPYLALFCKRDEPNSAYYSHFSMCVFEKIVIFCIVQGIFIFKKVFGFSKILCLIQFLILNLKIHTLNICKHVDSSEDRNSKEFSSPLDDRFRSSLQEVRERVGWVF